jgi:GntR family transcriptional regulator
MLTVRLDSDIPLTVQIAEGIRRQIAAVALRPGDELPTVRQLASDLGVNLNTVARAYRTLEDEGLLTTVRGRGTQVASATVAKSNRAESRARIEDRLRGALSDARLAELDQGAVEKLFHKLMKEFWRNAPENGG